MAMIGPRRPARSARGALCLAAMMAGGCFSFVTKEEGQKMQNEIISEAACRAWCTFQAPDYRLTQACVTAAATRKGLFPSPAASPASAPAQERTAPAAEMSPHPVVLHLADYR